VEGAAKRSYGLNVARLANLPEEILKSAKGKSSELEESIVNSKSSEKIAPSAFISLARDLFQLLKGNAERNVLVDVQKLIKGKMQE